MTSPNDGNLLQHPSGFSSVPTLNVSETKTVQRDEPPETSNTSLPVRSSSPSTLHTRASTITDALSRSSSPNGRLSLSFARPGRSPIASSVANPSESYDAIRSLFVRAFSPLIAIYASSDVDELSNRKGLKNGFTELLQPYGERINGKIVVRDSVGASRAWDDFGIHFHDLGRLAQDGISSQMDNPLEKLEDLLEQYLERLAQSTKEIETDIEISQLYKLFISRLLLSQRLSPHETFLHPVGTVIAISSSASQPIETLRNLYQQTAQGSRSLPPYANPEYLRYYVLVHDEDRDDFVRSSALFDQMKRHFGLHCHLLRLRSVSCSSLGEDSEEQPRREWFTPNEDLSRLRDTKNLIDLAEPKPAFIFSSDASAIRLFVRELVAQSIIPHMEQRIAFWNEQIASRRRGISGRFISLSKRWAGIGSSSRNVISATTLAGSGASGNYDSVQGFYRFDTPEALLRKLGDYAFMLRDYKLAASTYEMLRTDYANDKAWRYLAGANEMSCVATLLNPLASSGTSKFKVEGFDQMLETSSYSYLTRCSDLISALRSLLMGVELLKVRGRAACEIAAKWAIRILELGLVGSLGHVLLSERIANCFAAQIEIGSASWGTRKRKAAFWNIIAANEWMKAGRAEFAAVRLDEAQELRAGVKHGDSTQNFKEMSEFTEQLTLAVRMKLSQARQRGLSNVSARFDHKEIEVENEGVDDVVPLEKLDTRTSHRKSFVGDANPIQIMAPLSPMRMIRGDPLREDDDFE